MKHVYIIYCEGQRIDVHLYKKEAEAEIKKYYQPELYTVREIELAEEI